MRAGHRRKKDVGQAAVGGNGAPCTTVTLNPVAGYSNQNVMVRFRVGADESTGAPGWDIDDIAFSGLATTPFTALVPDAGVCTP
jgi:hypothetical protein